MLGKFILPWFGGSASTWLVCLLFFQVALLVGYAHAYAVTLPLPCRGRRRSSSRSWSEPAAAADHAL